MNTMIRVSSTSISGVTLISGPRAPLPAMEKDIESSCASLFSLARACLQDQTPGVTREFPWPQSIRRKHAKMYLTMARTPRHEILTLLALIFFFSALPPFSYAQDNYEIQVYSYDTVTPRSTKVEIHSNFTVDGSKTVQDGVLHSNHAGHETLDIGK